MKRFYECEFKSDIILKAAANTEAGALNLDFIPGGVFLGIVAKNYDKFSDPFYVFHSGKVKFSDANVLIDCDGSKKPSYKIPLSFHKLKVGDKHFNRLFLSSEDETKITDGGNQLKQIRDGYMSVNFDTYKLKYNYSQKSAHDKTKRRSKDEAMYGYESLEKGLKFLFSISSDDENTINNIEKFLIGEKFIGKSKTSEFGLVNIKRSNLSDEVESFKPKDDYTYIYAKSRIALFDENDGSTINLRKAGDLGLTSGEIDFAKSYIKTKNYSPFNAKKNSREMMRTFIEKGSIIAIKGANLGEIPSYMGAFLSEGFGEILVNPKFLEVRSNLNLEDRNKKETSKIKLLDEKLIKFLEEKSTKETNFLSLLDKAKEFQKKNKTSIKNSQWGAINEFVLTSKDEEEFIKNIEEFINKGTSKDQWSKNGFGEKFMNTLKSINNDKKLFIQILASNYRKENR